MADLIRQALERLQQYAAAHPEHDTAELVAAALATLAAKPPAPGPTTDDIWELCEDHEFHLGEGCDDEASAEIMLRIIRVALTRWGRPAPDLREVIAVRPLLEAVVALDVWGVEIYDGRLPALQHRIRAWLAENPPGQPVAIEPRGCPTPGACSCVEAPAPADPSDFQTLQGIALDMVESLRPIVLPEILGVLRRAIKQAPAPTPAADPLPGFAATLIASQRPMDPDVAAALTPEARWEMYDGAPAPAADSEHEELAQWLYCLADKRSCNRRRGIRPHPSALRRAAALLREARPQPVPVADRPWERPGWCDAEGRCWWGRCADDFFNPEWIMATLASIEEFCSDSMPQHCLPHWAIPIPQPPQANTTHPTPKEPPTDD